MDLFGDLPEPSQTGDVTGRPLQEMDDRSDKRKHEVCRDVESVEVEKKKFCKGWARLRAHVAARRGEREEMQDAHVVLPDLSTSLSSIPQEVSRLAYFAVFDGHGGSRASCFAAEHLHQALALKFPKGEVQNLDKLVRKCLVEAFRQTDEDFLKKASSQKPVWKDGTTATCMLVVNDDVYVANLGDSRAVLCREDQEGQDDNKKIVTLALSREHNPICYEERMRIQRAGGTVRDGRVFGTLEVSRSIGDGQYKRCGVISTPDLRRCQLSPNDKFFILACDGLFKVFTPEQAVTFVLSVLQNDTAEWNRDQAWKEASFEAACQQLASEAVRRGCADNVTVILVSIDF
ncbi:integrin-linked kinase-associated serine/threonine phosphatase 2C-like isoform X3 [Paramormyrops kingsleyae]|uniref:integrin-linked kinase-associated serine/threonine phosphatase 2C isoform X3 n=1 Tax=Paramormyrops kingsleyae TaxID=1676925 RepID=UPI000CD655BB|nr:integrin-linked kinase-associated serine/threonine phosphatase 2C isoform X3 [Paramormyrops kingsleyae]